MKKTYKIWFNHWFSTVPQIFNMIRALENDEVNIEIFATNDKESPLIEAGADHWELEPLYENHDQYISFCIDFIKKHNIDLFIPRRGRQAIAKEIDKFNELGVKVIVEDYETDKILGNKQSTYESLKGFGLSDLVPAYKIVNSAQNLITDYYEMADKYERVCIKKVEDEGAASFSELIGYDPDYNYLANSMYAGHKLNIYDVADILRIRLLEKKKVDDFIMMPYLTREVSCDCMRYKGEFICAVREDGPNHSTLVSKDSTYTKLAETLYDKFKLKGIANIQFRHDGDTIKLLEINTRMSGGIQKCNAVGLNMPKYMVGNALDLDVEYKEWNKENKVFRVISESIPRLIGEVTKNEGKTGAGGDGHE